MRTSPIAITSMAFILAPAASAQVSLVSQNRYVMLQDIFDTPAPDFGQYDASMNTTIDLINSGMTIPTQIEFTVTQSSELIGNQWTGSGAISMVGDVLFDTLPFHVRAQSFLDVVFDVGSPVDVNLQASAAFMTGVDFEGDVLLVDVTGGAFNPVAGITHEFTSPVNADLTLAPGQYRFLAFMDLLPTGDYIGPDNGSFGFDFSLTFVPAPASAALLGLGGLGLVRRRR